jgi:hypothetical protein
MKAKSSKAPDFTGRMRSWNPDTKNPLGWRVFCCLADVRIIFAANWLAGNLLENKGNQRVQAAAA